MSKAFNKVMVGLEDARAYLDGKRSGFAVHEVKIPEPDVAAIRGKTGLSQPVFAKSIGVSLGTLKNWEQGRRRPEDRPAYFWRCLKSIRQLFRKNSAARRPAAHDRRP